MPSARAPTPMRRNSPAYCVAKAGVDAASPRARNAPRARSRAEPRGVEEVGIMPAIRAGRRPTRLLPPGGAPGSRRPAAGSRCRRRPPAPRPGRGGGPRGHRADRAPGDVEVHELTVLGRHVREVAREVVPGTLQRALRLFA